MFIFHCKINRLLVFRIFLFAIFIFSLLILLIATQSFYRKANSASSSCMPNESVITMDSFSYPQILKEVYENIDDYIGKTVQLTGYIYKLYDFKDSEFVLARDMLINSDSQTVVVGFLCSSPDFTPPKEGTWINVTGKIIKGYYHNEIPVISVLSMEETQKPEEPYVFPPDEH